MQKLKLDQLNRSSVAEYKAEEKSNMIIVLDNIRSALNVGSVFRTSDAFKVRKLYLCGITAKPPHKEIIKTAIGATAAVEWEHKEDAEGVVDYLKAEGYIVAGVEQTDDKVWLQNWNPLPEDKIAIVLGNEVNGISDEIIPKLDYAIEIPQFGTKHSLNVSVCGGIICWDYWQKVNAAKKK